MKKTSDDWKPLGEDLEKIKKSVDFNVDEHLKILKKKDEIEKAIKEKKPIYNGDKQISEYDARYIVRQLEEKLK